jgi:hypothetical protein
MEDRETPRMKIWGKKNYSNYEENCTSRHFQTGTYEISGCLIFVEDLLPSLGSQQNTITSQTRKCRNYLKYHHIIRPTSNSEPKCMAITGQLLKKDSAPWCK